LKGIELETGKKCGDVLEGRAKRIVEGRWEGKWVGKCHGKLREVGWEVKGSGKGRRKDIEKGNGRGFEGVVS
jgi:hypothetical protein